MSQNTYKNYDDAKLLLLLKRGDPRAFEAIYERFWKGLFAYVYNRLQAKEISEEIVREVFTACWAKRDHLQVNASLSAYLYGAVRNGLLNTIRSANVRKAYAEDLTRFSQLGMIIQTKSGKR